MPDKYTGWILVLLNYLLSPRSQHDQFMIPVAPGYAYRQRHYYEEMEGVQNRLISLENSKTEKKVLKSN